MEQQVNTSKSPARQHPQGKKDGGAAPQKAPSHEEELAAQLAKIERELRRKERKLEKYNRVLKAKKHVRDTLRQHSATTNGQGTPHTAPPDQDSPPRSAKSCSLRNVTFSTRSPEVQYVPTGRDTPTMADRATPPPPTTPTAPTHTMLPHIGGEDEKRDQKGTSKDAETLKQGTGDEKSVQKDVETLKKGTSEDGRREEKGRFKDGKKPEKGSSKDLETLRQGRSEDSKREQQGGGKDKKIRQQGTERNATTPRLSKDPIPFPTEPIYACKERDIPTPDTRKRIPSTSFIPASREGHEAGSTVSKTPPIPTDSIDTSEEGNIVLSNTREHLPSTSFIPASREGHEKGTTVIRDTLDPNSERDSSTTDVTPSGLVNEELIHCTQAAIEDVGHRANKQDRGSMEFSSCLSNNMLSPQTYHTSSRHIDKAAIGDTEHRASKQDRGTIELSPPCPSNSALLPQPHHTTSKNVENENLPAQTHLTTSRDAEKENQEAKCDSTTNLGFPGHYLDLCWGDWPPLPIPPDPDPDPDPSTKAPRCPSPSMSLQNNSPAPGVEGTRDNLNQAITSPLSTSSHIPANNTSITRSPSLPSPQINPLAPSSEVTRDRLQKGCTQLLKTDPCSPANLRTNVARSSPWSLTPAPPAASSTPTQPRHIGAREEKTNSPDLFRTKPGEEMDVVRRSCISQRDRWRSRASQSSTESSGSTSSRREREKDCRRLTKEENSSQDMECVRGTVEDLSLEEEKDRTSKEERHNPISRQIHRRNVLQKSLNSDLKKQVHPRERDKQTPKIKRHNLIAQQNQRNIPQKSVNSDYGRQIQPKDTEEQTFNPQCKEEDRREDKTNRCMRETDDEREGKERRKREISEAENKKGDKIEVHMRKTGDEIEEKESRMGEIMDKEVRETRNRREDAISVHVREIKEIRERDESKPGGITDVDMRGGENEEEMEDSILEDTMDIHMKDIDVAQFLSPQSNQPPHQQFDLKTRYTTTPDTPNRKNPQRERDKTAKQTPEQNINIHLSQRGRGGITQTHVNKMLTRPAHTTTGSEERRAATQNERKGDGNSVDDGDVKMAYTSFTKKLNKPAYTTTSSEERRTATQDDRKEGDGDSVDDDVKMAYTSSTKKLKKPAHITTENERRKIQTQGDEIEGNNDDNSIDNKVVRLAYTSTAKKLNKPAHTTTENEKRRKITTWMDENDNSINIKIPHTSFTTTSTTTSIKQAEGVEGSEVETWTLPRKEGDGPILTTTITTVDGCCVLLTVQECTVGLWRLSPESGVWSLYGQTQHSIKGSAVIRNLSVVGLPSGEEARFLAVVQKEEEMVEAVYIQFSPSVGDWLLSSTDLQPPVRGAQTHTLCTLGEWSAAICWWAPEPQGKTGTLTVLDFDVAYSRRGRRWELLCHPFLATLPDVCVNGGPVTVASLLNESGPTGLLVCWSVGVANLTLYDPLQSAVIGQVPWPVGGGLLWALAVEELLFILSCRSTSGHPQDITLTALNPVSAQHDPFLTLTLGEKPGTLGGGHRAGWVTGVGLQLGRLTLSLTEGDGVHICLRGATEGR